MNCKPGQLAVIVRDAYPENINRIVEVIGPVPRQFLHACEPGHNWQVHAPTPLVLGVWRPGAGMSMPLMRDTRAFVLDANLRPISDPGDDVTDETADWLPVRSKETA